MRYIQYLTEVILAWIQMKEGKNLPEKYHHLFETELSEEGEIREAYQNLLAEESEEAEKYRTLIELCGNTEISRKLLDCCIAGLLYPEFYQFAKEQWNGITLDVMESLCDEEVTYKEMKQVWECAGRILQCEKNHGLFLRHVFWADTRILDYFLDPDVIDEKLTRVGTELYTGEEDPGEIYVNEVVEQELSDILRKEKGDCVQIAGNTGCGKKFLLKKACHATGQKMILADIRQIQQCKDGLLYPQLLIREGMLLDCGICLYHISQEALEQVLTHFLRPMLAQNIRVFLCTDMEAEVIPRIHSHVEYVLVPAYGRPERIALWKGFTEEHGIRKQVDCITAGSKFKLSAEEIRKAVERIVVTSAALTIGESEIGRICEEVLLKPSCGSIKRIPVQYTFDDLKLWPEQKRILNNICAHVWHRHKVYDEWNLESRYSYGKNVSALFYGPPGTGKTMAVHVIANMLNLPLYRIDLSQVVDKYIGETEKRLEEIFNAAEKNNTVLFFDEADAIFGKRSDVHEAKDKYANTEVSYILQRIEQYDGIVILATNYRKNIDEAFMRRIRYVVEFSLPDARLRKELWKSSFSDEIPTEYLDYDYLAEQFEISGGSIKNIVLNAAFLAAARNEPVSMLDVLYSIKNENAKTGKVMLSKDFGLYGDMMEEEAGK